ncbi:MAG: DUF4160 domain-containing protein [Acidobacteria bacterium]|nr:DUF4160 domain-containing protein [Acidobacteriota bacterium]
MSPTIFRSGPYRFYFFSREEPRIHIHVTSPDGEVKFWIEPMIELATRHGLNDRQLRSVEQIVRTNEEKIREAWRDHFGS